jgi:epidermal growth factor receptor substrate 15
MGGFDVFRSKYDPESNAFGPPENMDFAISSPDDDLFYIVDSLNKNAYFASARQSQVGKLFVYKVKVDRVPLQLAVIKGNFVSEIDATNKRIDFEIKDYSNGENIGKFNSNEKAVYLITFPKGGKYEFIMRVEGSPQEFRSIVSIPFMKEFKPLKQKIVHTMEEGKEVVKIINLFNEEVEDPQAVIAEVIKMRSNLNVNVQDFDMDKLEEERKNQEFLSELGFGALTHDRGFKFIG